MAYPHISLACFHRFLAIQISPEDEFQTVFTLDRFTTRPSGIKPLRELITLHTPCQVRWLCYLQPRHVLTLNTKLGKFRRELEPFEALYLQVHNAHMLFLSSIFFFFQFPGHQLGERVETSFQRRIATSRSEVHSYYIK